MSENPSRSRSPSATPTAAATATATSRGRAGYRTSELNTIPAGLAPGPQLMAAPSAPGQRQEILSNFIKISPMAESQIQSYRAEFEPQIESVRLRRSMLRAAIQDEFGQRGYEFDGMYDVRSAYVMPQDEKSYSINNEEMKQTYTIKLRKTGVMVWGSYEMVRMYNMIMKGFLRKMGYFQAIKRGDYLHPDLFTPVGSNQHLLTVRGFRTSINLHQNDEVLMNLEAVHKLMQRNNCNEMMLRDAHRNREQILALFTGALVLPSYNRLVYRVETVNFDLNPRSTFFCNRRQREITYVEYFKERYNVTIRDLGQPLMLVTQHNQRRAQREQDEPQKDIYLVPELCNMTGLTPSQRDDRNMKTDLIRSSQLDPNVRVEHLKTFLRQFHENPEIRAGLEKWGYSYAPELTKVQSRIIDRERVGLGDCVEANHSTWHTIEPNGDFERIVTRSRMAIVPEIPKMAILITRPDANVMDDILQRLKSGFQSVGLNLSERAVKVIRIAEGDSAQLYIQNLRQLPADCTIAIVVMTRQDSNKYQAIKKFCTCEKGLVTQVVTTRLLTDPRKAVGACKKIAIQVAAKVGGEPWRVHLPLSNTMICGYDATHDTANRGKSFGAFLASQNDKFSRWWSKAVSHDEQEELSSTMATNMVEACNRWREANGGERYPERIYLYRDGVGDGQLEHVHGVELNAILEALKNLSPTIKLSMIIVNKRIGARFYFPRQGRFENPPPGTVVDNTVTRKTRFDFYLISQSTRNGTVAPTYYNIIHDDTALPAERHQQMAYKLCLMYYNWTGTVRVPAPVQYAHKLAFQCGEHTHALPNNNLNHLLHFL